MVTMYDVAKRAGLSVGTVSRFFNESGYVSAAARTKIQTATVELGFVPSIAARSLTTKRTGLIGFVASDLGNPFTADLAHSISQRADQLGYSVVVSATDDDETRRLHTLEVLHSHRIDGLLVTPPETEAVNAKLVSMHRGGTPIVGIGLRLDPSVADTVTTDTYTGARTAVSHLLGLGHRRIGFVAGDSTLGIAQGRRQGFLDELREAGVRIDQSLIAEVPLNRQGGADAANRLLDRKRPPTAVFVANDAAALGVLQIAFQRRLRVPDDLSVVGFDDGDLAEHAIPPLTTVAQPTAEMGEQAVTLLLARIATTEGGEPAEVRLPCELVVRGSTAPPAKKAH